MNKNYIIVRSMEELSEDMYQKIKQIYQESHCVNESLINTFPDCEVWIKGDVVYIDCPQGVTGYYDREIAL